MSEWCPPPSFDGYVLERLLGRGGMGEVHLARDTLLDRAVAIKFVSATAQDEEARARFVVEARAIARLQHPNVVSVYRVGEVQGRPYLVSEYVQGTPLSELPTPVSAETALRVAMDIALALAAAHGRGVVHRDIKPANAILSSDGTVKLLDFGIAKLLQAASSPGAPEEQPHAAGPGGPAHSSVVAAHVGRELASETGLTRRDVGPGPPSRLPPDALPFGDHLLTRPGAALGTPRFMAPEAWLGEAATFRSDVYSLGALLYSLCAGRPPFAAARLDDLGRKVVAGGAVPLGELAPGLDPRLCAIVDRCLAREPQARFGSGGELRAALARLLPGGGREQIPPGNPYRGLRAFEGAHQNLFFGRDSEIRMILDRLRLEPYVLVAGDSGVGKSSLCRAGVLPRAQTWLGEQRTWSIVTLVPGRRPVVALAGALAAALGRPERLVEQAIVDDPGGLARELRAWQGQRRGLLLFVDQLEELVTASDTTQAHAFCAMLAWLLAPSPGTRVLASVRGDFLSRVASLPRLADDTARGLYFLRPLSAERVRDAVVGPAAATGVSFDPTSLVDELVEATAREDGGLPLLQFALAELWEARDAQTNVITRASLEAVGGVAGALTRHADQVLAQLAPGRRRAARAMLLELLHADGTRARRTEGELVGDDADRAHALPALVRGRLLVVRDGADCPYLEIAHEALVSGWSTLAGWLSAGAAARHVRERLRRAVDDWQRLGGADHGLWGSRQLDDVKLLDESSLASDEQVFLRRSRGVVRGARRRRVAAWTAFPVMMLVGYLALTLQAGWARRSRGLSELGRAELGMLEAGSLDARLEVRRQVAWRVFDAGATERGEQAWAESSELATRLRDVQARAAQLLESARLIDPTGPEARPLLARLLYERALEAERQGDRAAQQENLARLASYDDGTLGRQWSAPATLTVTTPAPGATVALGRYEPTAEQRYVLAPIELGPGGLQDVVLAPGAYRIDLRAPGRAPVVHTLRLGRGERSTLQLDMPLVGTVPAGFVYVPPGRFVFGSAAPDGQRRDFFHTTPAHEVDGRAFLIAAHETTFADWIAYLKALPAAARQEATPKVVAGGFQGGLGLASGGDDDWELTIQPAGQAYRARSGELLTYPGRTLRAAQNWLRFPVSGISVAQAEAYVTWLAQSGRVPNARLCTEHEWEHAARGADGREYPHGERLLPDDANHDETYGKASLALGPDEVGSHGASSSPYGVQDMAGNVWEWTRSSLAGNSHAARGGSFAFGPNSSRSTDRELTEPSFRDVSVGLRVCADAPLTDAPGR